MPALPYNLWDQFIDKVIAPNEESGYTMVVWPVEDAEHDQRIGAFYHGGSILMLSDAIPIRDLPVKAGFDTHLIKTVSYNVALPDRLFICLWGLPNAAITVSIDQIGPDRELAYPITFIRKRQAP